MTQNQPIDWRGLCEELVQALHGYASANPHHDSDALVARARAALQRKEPEVVGPTGDNIPIVPLSEHDLQQQWNQQADEFNQWDSLGLDEQLEWAQVRAIAAVLARWGRPAPAPAGERQAVPVAVSERLPGPEDCNGDEEVWAWRPFDSESDMDGGDFWSLSFHEWLEDEDCGFTHWLPANALPLPSGEVEG